MDEYFKSINYINGYHKHIEYVDSETRVKCLAFKRLNGSLDLFYDDFKEKGLFKEGCPRMDFVGAFLFNTIEETAQEDFQDWVVAVLKPFLAKGR